MRYTSDVLRITRALNWIGAAALALGMVVVAWALWWTRGVDDFRTAVIIAALGFGVPSVVALTLAWLLESLSQSAEHSAPDGAADAPATTAAFTPGVRKLPVAYCYLVATAAVAVAALLRMWLDSVLGDTAPFLTFFLAVVVAAWIGGFGPAALATALCVVVAWQWVLGGHGDLPPDQLGNFVAVSVFAATALVLGGITAAMRATAAAAARLSAATHNRNVELQAIEAELGREHARFKAILDAVGDTALASESSALVLLDRKGGEHVVRHLIAPILDGNGELLGSLVTVRTTAAGE